MIRGAAAFAALLASALVLALPVAAVAAGRDAKPAPAGQTARSPGAAGDRAAAAAARERARRIVAQRRFHGTPATRPLHGALSAIGRAVRTVTDPIGRLIDRVGRQVPGGPTGLKLLLGALVVALAALLTARSVRRRGAAVERLRGMGVGAAGGLDPDALEREADAAERANDLEAAVRLRFRAGLLRLDRARAIEFRPSITTTEVSGALRSPAFDELALTFEEVAYGGRTAAPPDVDEARREWPALLAAVGSR